jgi:hypothetical protein
MALVTKTDPFDSTLSNFGEIALMLGHERMDKTPFYLASSELFKILDKSVTDGAGPTMQRLRKFVSDGEHADFRAFARFVGRALDSQLSFLRDVEIVRMFPPVSNFLANLKNLEGILGELDYDGLVDVVGDFFGDQDVVDAAERLLIPANAEKVTFFPTPLTHEVGPQSSSGFHL